MERPSRGRLLISHITLRGPEIEQLYYLIRQRPAISYPDLVAALVPAGSSKGNVALDQAPLQEALNFLLVAGLVEQEGTARQRARFHTLAGGSSFVLTLLKQILAQPEERQRAMQLVHQQLVAEDVIALTLPHLRTLVEGGPYRHLFAWTGEKLLFWSQLMAHLGLVRRLERSTEFLLIPQLDLLEGALRWAAGCDVGFYSVDELLRHLDDGLFACFTTRGRVHGGLAQSLIALHHLGRVQLVHQADAARSHLLGHWRVSHLHWKES